MQLCTSLRMASSVDVASILEMTRPPSPIDWIRISAGAPETAAGRVAQLISPGSTSKSQWRSAPSITNIWS